MQGIRHSSSLARLCESNRLGDRNRLFESNIPCESNRLIISNMLCESMLGYVSVTDQIIETYVNITTRRLISRPTHNPLTPNVSATQFTDVV